MAHADARESGPPDDFLSAAIQVELKCRKCGYDLRGHTLDGRCPECGLECWLTVVREIDPAGSRLPQLNDPVGAANGLVFLMISLLAAAVLLVVASVARVMLEWDVVPSGLLQPLASPRMPYFAGVASLAGLWSLWKLLPSRLGSGGTSWSDLRMMIVGLVGWAFMAIMLGSLFTNPALADVRWSAYLVLHGCAVSCFLGLRGVFRTIGERSRAYRRSKGSKQSLTNMTLALVLLALGQMLQGQQYLGRWPDRLRTIGLMLVCVLTFMLIVGLMYLVANAWWIRRSIIRPPRELVTLLTPPPEEEPELKEPSGPDQS